VALESSPVVFGEPSLPRRRGPVLRRGPFPPRSDPVTPKSFCTPINQLGTRRNPASAHWRLCTLEELGPFLANCIPIAVSQCSYNGRHRRTTDIKAVGDRDCRHNSTSAQL
jgi:hypothetical protein